MSAEREGGAGYPSLRHAQLVGIRVGAALLILGCGLSAWTLGVISAENALGVTASGLFIVLASLAFKPLLAVIVSERSALLVSAVDRLLTVVGFTGVIYFLGGYEAAYLLPLYAVLTISAGVASPWRLPFAVAGMSIVFFALMLALEHVGVLPHVGVVPGVPMPWINQLAMLAVTVVLLVMCAFVSSRAARFIEASRARLRAQNEELRAPRTAPWNPAG